MIKNIIPSLKSLKFDLTSSNAVSVYPPKANRKFFIKV